ncbi:MAG: hypothetical protein RLN76_04730 [Phycisphaeraceae bacterium]
MQKSLALGLGCLIAPALASPATALELYEVLQFGPAHSETLLAPGGRDTADGAISNSAFGEETRQGSTGSFETEGTTFIGKNPTAIARVSGSASRAEGGAARNHGASAQATLTYQIVTLPFESGTEYGFDIPLTLFGTASIDEMGYTNGLGSSGEGNINVLDSNSIGVYSYSTDVIPEYLRQGQLQDFVGEFWMHPGMHHTLEIRAYADVAVTSGDGPGSINVATGETIIDPTFDFDQARYDDMRALDPSLPDIQLDDVFYLGITPGFVPEPSSAALLLISVAALKPRRQ